MIMKLKKQRTGPKGAVEAVKKIYIFKLNFKELAT
jgi:hypothetical protein